MKEKITKEIYGKATICNCSICEKAVCYKAEATYECGTLICFDCLAKYNETKPSKN